MRTLQGVIVSNKMKDTAVVRVDHLRKHKKYLKYITVSKKYKAHVASSDFLAGDIVEIQETRPMSKEKRWKVVKLVRRAAERQAEVEEETDDNTDITN
ncbi:30S ribosomal protein S17 [Patescibacteria group bacterium]|nr:30S ribosomal protein S17 [Patescibacteria group bacterium]